MGPALHAMGNPELARKRVEIPLTFARSLERDDFSSNRHPALAYWWSMIFSENRFPPFGIML
jgi:hypothetical protein